MLYRCSVDCIRLYEFHTQQTIVNKANIRTLFPPTKTQGEITSKTATPPPVMPVLGSLLPPSPCSRSDGLFQMPPTLPHTREVAKVPSWHPSHAYAAKDH